MRVTLQAAIRKAEPRDIDAAKDIINASFPRFFRFFATHSLDDDEGTLLVAEEERAVVGFAKLINFAVAGRKYGCILWLAVYPAHRRKGVASALVETGTKELKRDGSAAVFASVQRTNKASLATFRKEGFKSVSLWGLRRLFGWRVFQFYGDIWYAPGEVALMHE